MIDLDKVVELVRRKVMPGTVNRVLTVDDLPKIVETVIEAIGEVMEDK